MSLLIINLYEVGQFLRIFLWIFLPLSMISLLVTTYFHYRRRRRSGARMALSIDGYVFSQSEDDLSPFLTERGFSGPGESGADGAGRRAGSEASEGIAVERVGLEVTLTAEADAEKGTKPGKDAGLLAGIEIPGGGNGNIYKGILWMKEKYEQYVEQSDRRYERLKEDLARSEKKYEDLLDGQGGNVVPGIADRLVVPDGGGDAAEQASARDIIEEKNRQISFLQEQLDQRIKNYHQLEYQGRNDRQRVEELERQYTEVKNTLEERERRIVEIDGWLVIERSKVEDLVTKLQNNSLLLMNIYKELDKSMHIENPLGNPSESPM
jgi:hypothetical protein